MKNIEMLTRLVSTNKKLSGDMNYVKFISTLNDYIHDQYNTEMGLADVFKDKDNNPLITCPDCGHNTLIGYGNCNFCGCELMSDNSLNDVEKKPIQKPVKEDFVIISDDKIVENKDYIICDDDSDLEGKEVVEEINTGLKLVTDSLSGDQLFVDNINIDEEEHKRRQELLNGRKKYTDFIKPRHISFQELDTVTAEKIMGMRKVSLSALINRYGLRFDPHSKDFKGRNIKRLKELIIRELFYGDINPQYDNIEKVKVENNVVEIQKEDNVKAKVEDVEVEKEDKKELVTQNKPYFEGNKIEIKKADSNEYFNYPSPEELYKMEKLELLKVITDYKLNVHYDNMPIKETGDYPIADELNRMTDKELKDVILKFKFDIDTNRIRSIEKLAKTINVKIEDALDLLTKKIDEAIKSECNAANFTDISDNIEDKSIEKVEDLDEDDILTDAELQEDSDLWNEVVEDIDDIELELN